MKRLLVCIMVIIIVVSLTDFRVTTNASTLDQKVDSVEIIFHNVSKEGFKLDQYFYVGQTYTLFAAIKNKDKHLISGPQFTYKWTFAPSNSFQITSKDDSFIDVYATRKCIGFITLIVYENGEYVGHDLKVRIVRLHKLIDDLKPIAGYADDCDEECDPYPCRIIFEKNNTSEDNCLEINLNDGNKDLYYRPYMIPPNVDNYNYCDTCCFLSVSDAQSIRIKSCSTDTLEIGDWDDISNLRYRKIPCKPKKTGFCSITIEDDSIENLDPRSHLCVYITDNQKKLKSLTNDEFIISYDRAIIPNSSTEYPYPKNLTEFDVYPYKVLDFVFESDDESTFVISSSQPWLRTDSTIAKRIGKNKYMCKVLFYPYYLIPTQSNQENFAGVITIRDINGKYEPLRKYVYVETQDSINLELDKKEQTLTRIYKNGEKKVINGNIIQPRDYVLRDYGRHYFDVIKLAKWFGLKVEVDGKAFIVHRYGRYIEITKDTNTLAVKKFSSIFSVPPNQNPFEVESYEIPKTWFYDNNYQGEELFTYPLETKNIDQYLVMLRAALLEFGSSFEYNSSNPNILKMSITPIPISQIQQ